MITVFIDYYFIWDSCVATVFFCHEVSSFLTELTFTFVGHLSQAEGL